MTQIHGAKPGLIAALRAELRRRHYSPRTERAYATWVRRFVEFHGRRSPRELGAEELGAFLDDLIRQGLSRSSHQQALCALVFMYQQVLKSDPPWLAEMARPKQTRSLPVVLTRGEVTRVLAQMEGVTALMAALM